MMSLQASAMLLLYRMGRIGAAAVRRAVDDGLLTEEECQTILNFDKEDPA